MGRALHGLIVPGSGGNTSDLLTAKFGLLDHHVHVEAFVWYWMSSANRSTACLGFRRGAMECGESGRRS